MLTFNEVVGHENRKNQKVLKTKPKGARKRDRLTIYARDSVYSGRFTIELPSERGSYTLYQMNGKEKGVGSADAILVKTKASSSAYEWAHRIGEVLQSEEDVEAGLKMARQSGEVDAIIVFIEERLGIWGNFKLI